MAWSERTFHTVPPPNDEVDHVEEQRLNKVLKNMPPFIKLSSRRARRALVAYEEMKQRHIEALRDKAGHVWQSVLLIDDDETHLRMTRKILIKSGFSVMTAISGEEGLKIAEQYKPDLILLDVILPKMKGRDVCRVLKENEKTRHIPVVFLTAKESDDDIRGEFEAGGLGHVTKPIQAQSLISTIKKILK